MTPTILDRLQSAWQGFRRRKSARERANYTRSQVRQIVSTIRAKYDAAQTTEENRKHWSHADDLSANAANSPDVRSTLRRRARYERDNNSYCSGIISTLAGDLIGTGPRLQLSTASDTANRFIEQEFAAWCDATDLAGKLRLMDMGRHTDGETFALFTNNTKLPTRVQLDLRPIEADQVESPDYFGGDPRRISGIRLDEWGNPESYDLLKAHPGDVDLPATAEYRPVPAADMLHWFRPTRPGQLRGIPSITPAIPLFAQLRRYTLAVLCAAEIAAELAAFVQSNLPPGTEEPGPDPFETLEIIRGQITTLPSGWSISQLNPTQPTTTFGDFVERIIKEIARCLEMPWGLAGGDSSGYNYSSGRLDIQTYCRKVKIERADLERRIIDRIFTYWLDEAILVRGYLPLDGLGPYQSWRWAWHWDQFGHVDPSKEATAIQTLLEKNATTLSRIYAERGEDWREALEQLALERKEMERLGLSPQQAAPPPGGDASSAAAGDASADAEEGADAADA